MLKVIMYCKGEEIKGIKSGLIGVEQQQFFADL